METLVFSIAFLLFVLSVVCIRAQINDWLDPNTIEYGSKTFKIVGGSIPFITFFSMLSLMILFFSFFNLLIALCVLFGLIVFVWTFRMSFIAWFM